MSLDRASTSLQYDVVLKIVVVGDPSVGKSCMLLRFVDDVFNPTHLSTIGVDFKIMTIQIESRVVKLQIWDTAGQERFRNIVSSYYRGAHGIIVVYDVTNRSSFDHVHTWIEEIERYGTPRVTKMIVGNKVDLGDAHRVVAAGEGARLAQSVGASFLETSAKDSTNISLAFRMLATDIISNASLPMPQSLTAPTPFGGVSRLDGLSRSRARGSWDASGRGCC